MTSEELQRTMAFIVEQQAKFEVEIQRLFDSDKELRDADRRLREQQATLTAALVRLAEIAEENERRAQEQSKKTDQRFAQLAEAQKATDERLNVLIHVVEEHFVRRRNGGKRRKKQH